MIGPLKLHKFDVWEQSEESHRHMTHQFATLSKRLSNKNQRIRLKIDQSDDCKQRYKTRLKDRRVVDRAAIRQMYVCLESVYMYNIVLYIM